MMTTTTTTTTQKAAAAKTTAGKIARAPKASKAKALPFEPKTSGERAWIAWSNGAPADEAYYRRLDRMIDATKAHAAVPENYEAGWDLVVETMSDDQVRQIIWRARTDEGAIRKMAAHIAPLIEARSAKEVKE